MAFTGTLFARGRSGEVYARGMTVSDVAAAYCKSTSPFPAAEYHTFPEDVKIINTIFGAASSVTRFNILVNGNILGVYEFANSLVSVQGTHIATTPSGANKWIKAGTQVFLTQLA